MNMSKYIIKRTQSDNNGKSVASYLNIKGFYDERRPVRVFDNISDAEWYANEEREEQENRYTTWDKVVFEVKEIVVKANGGRLEIVEAEG